MPDGSRTRIRRTGIAVVGKPRDRQELAQRTPLGAGQLAQKLHAGEGAVLEIGPQARVHGAGAILEASSGPGVEGDRHQRREVSDHAGDARRPGRTVEDRQVQREGVEILADRQG